MPSASLNPIRHKTFWFEDATTLFQVGEVVFKVHGTLVSRLSPKLSDTISDPRPNNVVGKPSNSNGDIFEPLRIDCLPTMKGPISVQDLEYLLEHLYHDHPLSIDSELGRLTSILRTTSPDLLDFPRIHGLAKQLFENLFPIDVSAVLKPCPYQTQELELALELAMTYNLTSAQKRLSYCLVTNEHFHSESSNGTTPHLSPNYAARCHRLMDRVIDHFTPILFTPPATSHMQCTDVFADHWMPLVIQPALGNDGVYKPIETLESIKEIDWRKHGLCDSCFKDKIDEWSGEQEDIWRRIDTWLGANA